MTDYTAVLTVRYPGAQWTLDGDDYTGLTWLDDTPKPTKKTLDAAWPSVETELAAAAVTRARAVRYQLETDPLFFKSQRNEDGVTLDDWKAAVDKVREDLPMPEEVTR